MLCFSFVSIKDWLVFKQLKAEVSIKQYQKLSNTGTWINSTTLMIQ